MNAPATNALAVCYVCLRRPRVAGCMGLCVACHQLVSAVIFTREQGG